MMPSEWEQIFQMNIWHFQHDPYDPNHMKLGTIVNIASIIGLHPIANAAPYRASKAAVVELTKSLARELAQK